MNTSILIVEDEGLIALDLRKKLEQAGYTVPMVADNADDAMLGVESLRPSLVLMDIRLRGPRDGIDTADRIRRQFHIPVMFVTAHADRETLDRARITEPFGYIVKPFHGVDFRAQIEMALWKHKMEQKLRVSEAWLATTFRNVADALMRPRKVRSGLRTSASRLWWLRRSSGGRKSIGCTNDLPGLSCPTMCMSSCAHFDPYPK